MKEENWHIFDSLRRGYPYEMADVEDEAYFDGQIAAKTIEDLKRLEEQGNPFFLATGFLKPHLPFNTPQKYWNIYPEESISLPDNYYPPRNAPPCSYSQFW